MNFVDRYALAVTAANRNIYLQQAAAFAAVFKEHGASSVVECWSDDVPEGKLTSLPTAVQRKAVQCRAKQTRQSFFYRSAGLTRCAQRWYERRDERPTAERCRDVVCMESG